MCGYSYNITLENQVAIPVCTGNTYCSTQTVITRSSHKFALHVQTKSISYCFDPIPPPVIELQGAAIKQHQMSVQRAAHV